MSRDKIKVLIAKPGLDGHEMGARLISLFLMEAGMEVVYTGPRQTPQSVVETALQEDVDVIGLSFLTGAHKEHTARVFALMKERGMDVGRFVVLVGGIIPNRDIPHLKGLGVHEVFGPGTDTRKVVETIRTAVAARRA